MKKIISIIVAVILCAVLGLAIAFAVLVGCDADVDNEDGTEEETEEKLDKPGKKTDEEPDLKELQAESDSLLAVEGEDIAYVMIYNPEIYDENLTRNMSLSTGDFSASVEAVVSRGENLDELPEIIPMAAMYDELPSPDGEGVRGDVLVEPYEVGDTHDFYCGRTQPRQIQTFECLYAGEYCNVWTFNDYITTQEAEEYGKEFDENIYTQAVKTFGKPRFEGNVNLFFYNFEPSGVVGFFAPADLIATGEYNQATIDYYGMNLDHNIITLNALWKNRKDILNSTLVHEFQHLICRTNGYGYTGKPHVRVWLNEAMSGYSEEMFYSGSKEDDCGGFERSNRIRHGQSLYNFDTTLTNPGYDAGVYGSVYLFSEYLSDMAGDNVFSKVHSYWKDSYSKTLDEAEAIANSVPKSVYNDISECVDYDGMVDFTDEDDEWLSKLTLDFYISLFTGNGPDAYENVDVDTLLYDEINPADIEGGGRVIVSLKDDEFKFPSDADDGLVYVGFNKDFEVVTEIVVR